MNIPILVASVVTTVWLMATFFYLFLYICDVISLGPNELGDFVAGIFAPLTLVWLIAAVFFQRTELRASTEALGLQAEQLTHSVKELRFQNEILHKDFQHRSYERNEAALERILLLTCRNILASLSSLDTSRHFHRGDQTTHVIMSLAKIQTELENEKPLEFLRQLKSLFYSLISSYGQEHLVSWRKSDKSFNGIFLETEEYLRDFFDANRSLFTSVFTKEIDNLRLSELLKKLRESDPVNLPVSFMFIDNIPHHVVEGQIVPQLWSSMDK